MRRLGDHPGLAVSVHLSVVDDSLGARWGPAVPAAAVPSLPDEDGHLSLASRMHETLARAELDDIEREFRAQVDAALAAGVRPSHFDWPCPNDGGHPDIFEVTLRLGGERGTALRVGTAAGRARVRALGLPAADHPMRDNFRLPPTGKPRHYAESSRGSRPGLTKRAVHPGLDTDAARTLDVDGWKVRATDPAVLCSPDATEHVAREGVALISHADLRRAWSDVAS